MTMLLTFLHIQSEIPRRIYTRFGTYRLVRHVTTFSIQASERYTFSISNNLRRKPYFVLSRIIPKNNSFSTLNHTHLDDHELDLDVERFTNSCMSQFLPQSTQIQFNLEREYETDLSNINERYRKVDEFDNDKPHIEGMIENNEFANQTMQNIEMQNKSMPLLELISKFQPENPPNLHNYQTRQEGLEAMQCWLECDALSESVAKYQRIIDDARNRNDYNSLSFVERQIARWFVPLQEAIEAKKQAFLMKDQGSKDPSYHKFGPLLCSLPSAKLAVIVAHQAIVQCATSSASYNNNDKPHSALGARFTRLAIAVGQNVEDEVMIHKLLHKRSIEQSQEKSNIAPTNFEKDVSAMFQDEGDSLNNAEHDASQNTKDSYNWSYSSSHLKEYLAEVGQNRPSEKKRRIVSRAVQKARQAVDSAETWTDVDKVQLGSALLQILIETVTIGSEGREEMAFSKELHYVGAKRAQSFLTMNDQFLKMIVSDNIDALNATTTRHKPMIVPPKPWTTARKGGYIVLEVDIMRYHGCTTQREAIMNAESSIVFDGLNALSRVKWVIHKPLLSVAQRCWDENIPLGDIPSRTDFPLPEQPVAPSWSGMKFEKGSDGYDASISELLKYRDRLHKYNRTKQKNMDLVSLRCSTMLKLNQAEKFKDFDEIYFPYNMDFRGRAYPIPPHFSNVGSDLCRGMLKFAEAKPLGERGLFWLKVHLANLAGKDKMTFEGRANFVDEHFDKVRMSAADPFGGERWWMTLENPFQALATCYEIVNAVNSGDPSTYMCALPVHMDGSCNGLQHYAALGRDLIGGKAVNLCVTDEPQDVYIGVMHEVIRRVAAEANRSLSFDTSNVEALSHAQKLEMKSNRAAKLVDGLIDRGVVKRTVMTSVYGVTYVGARQQIQEKIEQKLTGIGHDVDEIDFEVFNACSYLALVTLEVIGDLFYGAKCTMNWLTTCARLITQHGYPVAWISPIGLPAVQPYRQKKSAKVVTLAQTVSLSVISDDLPIHKSRQVSAFPPNFIHSLDSSHMLLTALEMDRRRLTFSAVHDSFWTHPCDVDEMNCALRDTFVDLYNQPLLERLKETWELRYPDLNFPDLPKRGQLNLSDVLNAKYFFQ